ncbi:hypothetical protein CI109_106752 [Kwoniella shandongensis]|uniref:Uncharacterized protein n=1 Tax=Kwoniella shandongensis TaxID=1734106 RepID=A0A5M6C7E4_9TREE|nr:uncharacterized protein CI109_000991 [Kwoniella shandongensis]KAA5530811.1 hypothetical protein CI109_000991 [Kwoniella shandongensis]
MLLYLVRHGQTALNEAGKVQGLIDEPLSPQGQDQARKLAQHLKLIPFTEAWSSPTKRAQETAEVILSAQPRAKAKLYIDGRLRSRAFGTAEGKLWDEVCCRLSECGIEPEEQLLSRLHDWLSVLVRMHTPTSSTATSPTSPLSPVSPLPTDPFDTPSIVRSLPRPGIARTPSASASSGLAGKNGIVLVVTHQACLKGFLRILTRDEPKSPIDLHVPDSLTINTDTDKEEKMEMVVGNASVAIVRVWWEDGEARGRLEAWGDEDHLLNTDGDEEDVWAEDASGK